MGTSEQSFSLSMKREKKRNLFMGPFFIENPLPPNSLSFTEKPNLNWTFIA